MLTTSTPRITNHVAPCKQHRVLTHDLFVSYRAKIDGEFIAKFVPFIENLAARRLNRPVCVFLDSQCLNYGVNWEDGSLGALNASSVGLYFLSEQSLLQMIENVQNGLEDKLLLQIETGLSVSDTQILPILIDCNAKKLIKITGHGSLSNPETYPDLPHVRTMKNFRATMVSLFLNRAIHVAPDIAEVHKIAYDIVDLIAPLSVASGIKFSSSIVPPEHFTGREFEINQIWKQIVSFGSCVIVGAGGMGKSSIAAKIVTIKRQYYQVVFWIPCNTTLSIATWFQNLLSSYSIAFDPSLDNKALVGKGMEYLHTQGIRQLFVLDNVDDEGVLEIFSSKFLGSDVLVTSRSSIVHVKLRRITTPKISCFHLDKWSVEQTKAFFAARLPSMIPSKPSDEMDAFLSTVQFIDGYPLAAEQAAALIKTKNVPWISFKQSLHDVPKHAPDPNFAPIGPLKQQENSLAAIMHLSFELVGSAALHLFSIIGYFKNDNIPRQLLEAGCNTLLSTDVNRTIQLLLRQSLLHTTDNVNYMTHSLQQSVARDLSSDTVILQNALDAVAKCFPKEVNSSFDSKAKEVGLKLATHIEQLSTFVSHTNDLPTKTLTLLQFDCQKLYRFLGMYGLQQQFLQQLLQCLDSNMDLYQEMQEIYAAALSDLGGSFWRLGDFKKAERYMKQSVDLKVKVYGTYEHESVATTLNNLGLLARDQGKFDEAQQYYDKDLAISVKMYGTQDHMDVATTLNNLGLLTRDQGKFEAAWKYYNESLDIKLKVLGTREHVNVAATLNNLGLLARDQEKFDEAQKYHKESLEIIIKMLGTHEHIDVATTLDNLGGLASDQGKFDEAHQYYTESLAIITKIFDTHEHVDVATTLNNLGLLAKDQRKFNKAKQYLTESLAIKIKMFGTYEHLDVATTLNNLGLLARDQGKFDEAQKYLSKSLAIEKKMFGADENLSVATTLTHLGNVGFNLGKYDEAEKYYKQAHKIFVKVYGNEDHSTVKAVCNWLEKLEELRNATPNMGNTFLKNFFQWFSKK